MSPNDFELEILKEHFCGDELVGAIKRFESGEPLAYIIGEWYFYGRTFKLNTDCLIPRPDTEHIVEKVMELLPKDGAFADLCTGSGCIAVSVLAERSDASAIAVDISDNALKMASLNAALNGVPCSNGLDHKKRISFLQKDVFELTLPNKTFDVIVSNPPYIRSEVIPTLETVQHEPKLALDGGSDGLDFYRHIVSYFSLALKENGVFVFEIGYDQREDISAIAKENGFICEVFRDYGGNDRVAVLRRCGND